MPFRYLRATLDVAMLDYFDMPAMLFSRCRRYAIFDYVPFDALMSHTPQPPALRR